MVWTESRTKKGRWNCNSFNLHGVWDNVLNLALLNFVPPTLIINFIYYESYSNLPSSSVMGGQS